MLSTGTGTQLNDSHIFIFCARYSCRFPSICTYFLLFIFKNIYSAPNVSAQAQTGGGLFNYVV